MEQAIAKRYKLSQMKQAIPQWNKLLLSEIGYHK
jgi:hypothetical protein